jgi:hypothetical protein
MVFWGVFLPYGHDSGTGIPAVTVDQIPKNSVLQNEVSANMNIQFVTDDQGNRIAVQIPMHDWEIIKAELESYDADVETVEIAADAELLESIDRGREQAKRKRGRRVEEIDL